MIRYAASSLLSTGALLLAACANDGPVTPPLDCTEEIEGACWTSLGLDGAWITELADTPVGLYAGTHDRGVFRYEADTGDWIPLGLDHAIVSSILYVPTEPARLLVGVMPFSDETTEAAVFASEDGGNSWVPWDDGLARGRGDRGWAYSLAVDPADPRRLFMSYFDVMMRSEDEGETWDAVWNELSRIGGGRFHTIFVSPQDPDHIWAGGVSSIFTAWILRTDDGGESWQLIDPTPRHENTVRALVQVPGQSDMLLAGLTGVGPGVMRSTDAGLSWDYVLSTPGGGGINALLSSGEIVYAAALEDFRPPPSGDEPLTDLGVYRSGNGGLTWEAIATPEHLPGAYALEPAVSDALMVGTRGSGVWRVVLDDSQSY